MHRYTSLLWDSNKKTLLGKNGVSWLSIILGSLVVIIAISVLVHCIKEVKKSRQESEAAMRKSALEKKRLLLTQSAQVSTTNESSFTPRINMSNSVVALEEKTDDYEDNKDSSMVLRNKRQISKPQNTTDEDIISLTTSRDIIYEDTIEKKNGTRAERQSSVIIKKGNNVIIRRKRQFYGVATDRAEFKDGDGIKITNLSKTKSSGDNKETAYSEPFAQLKIINTKSKRHIAVTTFLNKFSEVNVDKFKKQKSTYNNNNNIPDKTVLFHIRANEKLPNALTANIGTVERKPIAKILNTFANLKFEHLKKRITISSTVPEVFETKRTENGRGSNKNKIATSHFNNTKDLTPVAVFGHIAQTKLERLGKNRTATFLANALNKNYEGPTTSYGISKVNCSEKCAMEMRSGASFFEKLTAAKTARLKRNVPILATMEEVFNRSATEKNIHFLTRN